MNEPTTPLLKMGSRLPRAAIFLSGSGTNAEVILERRRTAALPAFTPAALVTDAPETSRARELATRFGIELIALDIRAFYRARGECSIRLSTPRGREIREEWTAELRRLIAPCNIDFGILAGFVPLTNLTGDFPCLNVHPGDLTVCAPDGSRLLAGLHLLPVEKAITMGLPTLRSSVILAQSYTGNGDKEMDSGPILGISEPVPVRLDGHSVAELAAVRDLRPGGKRPAEPDLLEIIARRNIENLKVNGDHVVFPRVIDAFASGRYGRRGATLCFRGEDGRFVPVETVEFSRSDATPIPI
ncbi:MAG: hypothetical protein AB7F32_12150 [Victivallaceae bacterium]